MIAARPGILSDSAHHVLKLLAEWSRWAREPDTFRPSQDAWRYGKNAGFIFGTAAVKAANEETRRALERHQPREARDQRNVGRQR